MRAKRTSDRHNSTWRGRLRSVYGSFQEFLSESCGGEVAARLGYGSSQEAWIANPLIAGDADPQEYRALSSPKPKTAVIFRKWRDTGDIIAVFPHEAGDMNPATCSSYMHVGQHGACRPKQLIPVTCLAKPSEYRSLAQELRRIGYNLSIVRRLQTWHQEMRVATVNSL
jgi:hypothetical protein